MPRCKSKRPQPGGNRLPQPILPTGFSLLSELKLLADSGLQPIDTFVGLDNERGGIPTEGKDGGSIQAGKTADIVLLNAKPLEKSPTPKNRGGICSGQIL